MLPALRAAALFATDVRFLDWLFSKEQVEVRQKRRAVRRMTRALRRHLRKVRRSKRG